MLEKMGYTAHSLTGRLWQAICDADPRRTALQAFTDPETGTDGEKITYQELSGEIRRISKEFAAKGVIGKRIGIMMERKPFAIINLLACIASGCAAVLLNPDEDKDRIDQKLERTGCALLIEETGSVPLQNEEPAGPDEAFLFFTSGTSGEEKCVIRTAENMLSSAIFCAKALHHGPVQILNLPLYHLAAWDRLLLPAFMKGCTVILSRGPGNWMEEIRSLAPEEIFVVPAQASLLLSLFGDDPEESLSSLRTIISTGAALSSDVKSKYASFGIKCLDVYGSSEGGGITNPFYQDGKYDTRPGSVGKLMPELAFRIADPDPDGYGELLLNGPTVFSGYLHDAENTQEILKDGWLHTGDRVKVDEDGFLYLNGRVKNLIILESGENVSPEELEELFRNTEGVRECLCFEYKNAITMEIVPDEAWFAAHSKTDQEDYLRENADRINGRLPSWKRVSRVYLRKEPFERTASGKMKRTGLIPPEEEGCIPLIMRESVDEAAQELSPEDAVHAAYKTAFPGRKINAQDDFFTLGGDSLSAVRITALLDEMGYAVSVRDLFSHSRIGEFTAYLKKQKEDDPLPMRGGIVALQIPEEELQEIRTAFSEETIEAVFPISGYGGISDLRLDKIRRHQMGFYFIDRMLIPKEPLEEKEFYGRIKELAARHPVLRSKFIKTSGGWRQVILKEKSILAVFKDWSSLDGDAAYKLRRAMEEYQARYKQKEKEPLPELLRLTGYSLTQKQSVIFFELTHLSTDRMSETLLIKELLDGPKTDSADHYLQARVWQSRSDNKQEEEALCFWEDFEKTVYRENIRSIRPEGRKLFPIKVFEVRLDEEELSLVRKAGSSNRATPTETVTYLFLRVLMEIFSLESILFKERFDGRKSMPFDASDTVGEFPRDGLMYLRKTDTLTDYHERLACIAVYSGSGSPYLKRKLREVPLLINKFVGENIFSDNCSSIMSLRNTESFPLPGEGIRSFDIDSRGRNFMIRIKYTGGDSFIERLERISACMKRMLVRLEEGGV